MAQPNASEAAAPRLRNGKTLAQRQSERRDALVNAALDVIGEDGATAVTVRELCRRTGLTARYFYESFSGRDQLIEEIFTDVANELHGALVDALSHAPSDDEVARLVVTTFVDVITNDPRKSRLLLVEPFAEKGLAGISLAQVPAFTRIIRDQMPASASPVSRNLAAVGLAGAVAAIFSSWVTGSVRASREEVIEHCVGLIRGTVSGGATPTP